MFKSSQSSPCRQIVAERCIIDRCIPDSSMSLAQIFDRYINGEQLRDPRYPSISESLDEEPLRYDSEFGDAPSVHQMSDDIDYVRKRQIELQQAVEKASPGSSDPEQTSEA